MKASPERIDVAGLTPQPWRNGAGTTRELARGGSEGDAFGWRLSVATIGADAPFSAFPGVDRCIVLLRGAGVRLRGAGIDHSLATPLAPWRFAGETAVGATLVDGPCDDLNVMTRRGAFSSRVDVHRAAGTLEAAAGPSVALLLLAAGGRWRVRDGETPLDDLAPWHAALWRDRPAARLRIAPLDRGGAVVSVAVCHDPRR